MGLDWALDTSFTRFRKPNLFHDGKNEVYVQGDRLVFNPQISAPFIRSAFFVVPKLSWHATSYQLSNTNIGEATSLQRTVPTFSVDSGLIFERQAKLFDMDLTQTLEPRLFYVKTPYRDQDKFPVFDTGQADFNFAQIFNENRFTGQDRIGDANQITAALTSRYIQDSGEERMKFAVGQRIYFNTQKVGTDLSGATQSRSNLLLAASGNLSNALSFDATKQISQSDGQTVNSNYGLSWHPADKKY